MPRPFFSDPIFAWAFCALLVGLAAVAAYEDLRKAVVPKWLTLSALGLGLVFNIVRGVLMGARGGNLWLFSNSNVWTGALDGLLLALLGFLVGFGLFFGMWALGACGGGDVKLFAALGAWLGPFLVILVMVVSAVILVLMVPVWLLAGGALSPAAVRERIKGVPFKGREAGPKKRKRSPSFRMTYALPVALGTVVVLLWFFRIDLGLMAPKPQNDAEVQARAN